MAPPQSDCWIPGKVEPEAPHIRGKNCAAWKHEGDRGEEDKVLRRIRVSERSVRDIHGKPNIEKLMVVNGTTRESFST